MWTVLEKTATRLRHRNSRNPSRNGFAAAHRSARTLTRWTLERALRAVPLHFRRLGSNPIEPRRPRSTGRRGVGVRWCADTQTDMLPGEPGGAICVQSLDDSLNSAIRTTYRISLRSSSLREPRYPLLEVVWLCSCGAAVGPRTTSCA